VRKRRTDSSRGQEASRQVSYEVAHNRRQEATSRCTRERENEADRQSAKEAPAALIDVGEAKKDGRGQNPRGDRLAEPRCEDVLGKAAVDEFLTEGYGDGQGEKYPAFACVLEKPSAPFAGAASQDRGVAWPGP